MSAIWAHRTFHGVATGERIRPFNWRNFLVKGQAPHELQAGNAGSLYRTSNLWRLAFTEPRFIHPAAKLSLGNEAQVSSEATSNDDYDKVWSDPEEKYGESGFEMATDQNVSTGHQKFQAPNLKLVNWRQKRLDFIFNFDPWGVLRGWENQNYMGTTPRKYVLDVTSVGQRSSPWTCSSVKIEMKFHLECKLHFPSAILMLRQMLLTNVFESIEATYWVSWLSTFKKRKYAKSDQAKPGLKFVLHTGFWTSMEPLV